ncbi:unnamed protein product [Vitrella brassicaformis CCMP3155]|uniref:Methyltransferase domain-containing protein n=3 Tax=Vitrella brassicaformis TaxID=1169539 RepID=A0A0G4EDY4_VITBC|nr:unnamed protein product [Vitrella brassicaformis CCMP3155]|eukprot:CEL93557.1 unnamed protein product [Vitrella brassicaformis CCMP3155]
MQDRRLPRGRPKPYSTMMVLLTTIFITIAFIGLYEAQQWAWQQHLVSADDNSNRQPSASDDPQPRQRELAPVAAAPEPPVSVHKTDEPTTSCLPVAVPKRMSLEEKEAIADAFMSVVSTREAFPLLLNYLGMYRIGTGGEIGVYNGEFSDRLLRLSSPKRYHMIEPKAKRFFEVRRELLQGERSFDISWHRNYSQEAASLFDDGYFDFLYVDGSHSHDDVLRDLHLYYPKMRKGAILAGHDFCGKRSKQLVNVGGKKRKIPWCGEYDTLHQDLTRKHATGGRQKRSMSGCAKAVLSFFHGLNITVHFTREDRPALDPLSQDPHSPIPHLNPSWWCLVR